jgi:hypothetical protein
MKSYFKKLLLPVRCGAARKMPLLRSVNDSLAKLRASAAANALRLKNGRERFIEISSIISLAIIYIWPDKVAITHPQRCLKDTVSSTPSVLLAVSGSRNQSARTRKTEVLHAMDTLKR